MYTYIYFCQTWTFTQSLTFRWKESLLGIYCVSPTYDHDLLPPYLTFPTFFRPQLSPAFLTCSQKLASNGKESKTETVGIEEKTGDKKRRGSRITKNNAEVETGVRHTHSQWYRGHVPLWVFNTTVWQTALRLNVQTLLNNSLFSGCISAQYRPVSFLLFICRRPAVHSFLKLKLKKKKKTFCDVLRPS